MSTNLKSKYVSRIARFAVALMGILVLTNIAIAQQKSNPVSTVNPDKWQGFYGGVSVGYMMGWYQKADGTTDTGSMVPWAEFSSGMIGSQDKRSTG